MQTYPTCEDGPKCHAAFGRIPWQPVREMPHNHAEPQGWAGGGRSMEEVLVLVIQGIFELCLQMLAYSGLEWSLWGRDRDDDLGCSYIFVFLGVGMLFGGLINCVHPRLMTPWPAVRI